MNTSLSKSYKELASHLRGGAKNILLINHRRMDGDAYGSLAGMYYIFQNIGGFQLFVTNDDLTPKAFQFLDDTEIFTQNLDLSSLSLDLIISFDVASLEQLGEVYKTHRETFQSTPWVNIDHHPSNPLFGTIHIVDLSASSTCEIVWDIIKYMDWQTYMDSKIATFLLTGLITDTNSFFNTNSTPKAYQSASELMAYSPRHQDIIINLFKQKPFTRLKLWGKLLESLKDIAGGKIVWNIVPRSLFIQTQTSDQDISGFIDEFLMTIDGLEIGFLLYELANGKIKGSFRGKNTSLDLSKFCTNWGGGGHKVASGFVVEGKNIFEVEGEVIQQLQLLLSQR